MRSIMKTIFIVLSFTFIFFGCNTGLADIIKDNVEDVATPEHSLTINISGSGSSTPTGTITLKQNVQLNISAVPASNNRFVEWRVLSGEGVVIENTESAETTVRLTLGDGTIQAVFVTTDIIRPSVTITTPFNPVNYLPIFLTITFSEEITGLDTEDVVVTNAILTELTTTNNSIYTAQLTEPADDPVTISVVIPAEAVVDLAGNTNTSATLNINFNTSILSTIISSEVSDPTNADSFVVNIVFSAEVTNFDFSDLVIDNCTFTGFSGSGTDYTVTIEPDTDGLVSINLPEGAAQSVETGWGSQAAAFSVYSDRTAPEPPTIAGLTAGSYETAQSFTLTNIEPLATAEYSLDGTNWVDYNGEVTIDISGDYQISTRQTDDVGNISESSDAVGIIILDEFTLTLDIAPNGSVTVNSEVYTSTGSPHSFTVTEGDTVTMGTEVNGYAYIFGGWSGTDWAEVSGSEPDFSILMDSDKDVQCDFIQDPDLLFVSSIGNDSSGTGAADAPYLTIGRAIAVWSTGQEIRVSQGTYNEYIDNIDNGMVLNGGYNSSDWSDRNPGAYTTMISRTSFPAVSVYGSRGNQTVIDGFTINGGINCEAGASITISNNIIIDSTGTNAIYGYNSSPVIFSNVIYGDTSGYTTAGAAVSLGFSSSEISYCTIYGGTNGISTTGIIVSNTGAGMKIHHNTIYGGASPYAHTESGGSYGIMIGGGTSFPIYNNLIYGGNSTRESAGIINYGVSGCKIQNNTIDGGSNSSATSYGVYDASSGLSSVVENNIIFFTAAVASEGVFSDSTQVSNNCLYDCGDSAGYVGSNGNINSDPFLGGSNGMELTADSIAVSEAGKTIAGIIDDFAETTRTAPYSIGAYEYNE